MQYIPGQAQAALEVDGVRRFTEDELRNIARVLAEGDTAIRALATRITVVELAPVFRIELLTQQTVTTSVYTKVFLDTLMADSHSAWDMANRRYVAKRSGWYRFEWHLYFGLSATFTLAFSAATKNGVPSSANIVGYGSSGMGSQPFSVGSGLVFLNGTTDYVELYAWPAATTPIIGSTGNQGLASFSCEWIRS